MSWRWRKPCNLDHRTTVSDTVYGHTMTITTSTGSVHTVTTESELLDLCAKVRFAIRSEQGERRYFVDGREVSESEYAEAVALVDQLQIA